jgi:serine phosphatase RsbU (regulator of sigma subunit)
MGLFTKSKKYAYILILVIASFCSYAQQFEKKLFTINDGLIHNMSNSLHIDKHGFLWISYSASGISKFDGVNFTHYDNNLGEYTYLSNQILDLPNGGILFKARQNIFEITSGRVSKYVNTDTATFSHVLESGTRTLRLHNIHLTEKGTAYFNPNREKLFYFDRQKIKQIKLPEKKKAVVLDNSKGKCLLYLADTAINNRAKCLFPESQLYSLKGDKIAKLITIQENRVVLNFQTIDSVNYFFYLWNTLTSEYYLLKYNTHDKTQTYYELKNEEPTYKTLVNLKENGFCFATKKSLWFINKRNEISRVELPQELAANPNLIRMIAYKEGFICGNYFYVNGIFNKLFSSDESGHIVFDIIKDDFENIWFATKNGLLRLSERKISINTPYNYFNDNGVLFVDDYERTYKFNYSRDYNRESVFIYDNRFKLIDSFGYKSPYDGKFVTHGKYSYIILEDRVIEIDSGLKKTEHKLPSRSRIINTPAEIGPDGQLAIPNGNEIVLFSKGKFETIKVPHTDETSQNIFFMDKHIMAVVFSDSVFFYDKSNKIINIRSIEKGYQYYDKANDRIWVFPHIASKIIYCINNDGIEEYKTEKEVDIKLLFNGYYIFKDYLIKKWKNYFFIPLSSFGKGVALYSIDKANKKFHFEIVTSSNGLPYDRVNYSFVDRVNNIWFFNQIDERVYYLPMPDFIKKEFKNMNELSMSGLAGPRSHSESVFGNYFVPVDDGIMKIGKEYNSQTYNSPLRFNFALLTQGNTLDTITDFSKDLEMEYNSSIKVFFSDIDLTHKKDIKYYYRLNNYEKEFNTVVNNGFAYYPNLPSGKYTLELYSINSYGVKNVCKQRFVILIKKPFWQQIWFYILIVLIIVAFGYILVKRRERKLKLENERLENVISERTLEIREQKHLIEEKHKEITDSINYAERIQKSFLATKELLDSNLKEYFVFFQPKDVVSGDFYWACKLKNNNFILATADSTGHGVPGAIMSILNISSLEKAVEQGLTEPAEIFNHTRKTIIERLKKDGSKEGGKDGMDCSLISLNFKNKSLTYSAANNPVWIIRKNQLLEFAPDKMPVGKHDKDSVPFTQHTVELQDGDIIYTLTDGMPDQFGGPKGKKYMYKQLKEFLIQISSLPLHEQKDRLQTSFNEWKRDLEQIDDVCIIGVKL